MLDARVLGAIEQQAKPMTVNALVFELRTWIASNQKLLTAYNTVHGFAPPKKLVRASVDRLRKRGLLRRVQNIYYERCQEGAL